MYGNRYNMSVGTTLRSNLKMLLGWPLSALALFFLFKTIAPESQKILPSLQNVNVLLIIYGVISFLTYYALRSWVWNELLRAKGHHLPLRETAFAWGISEVKRYIPGNIWSYLGRTVSFSEKGVSKKDVARLLVIEAGAIFLSAALVSLLSLPFLFTYVFPTIPWQEELKEGAILLTIAAGIAYTYQGRLHRILPTRLRGIAGIVFTDFTPRVNLTILLLNCLAFFTFGLGYYFSLSAITLLPPDKILQLIGFFVFSLLVGLLSFITPTGLGVREGAIAVGLTKLLGTGIAGFAALFGRVLLVATELLFIAITYLWQQIKHKSIAKEEDWIKHHPHETVLLILSTLFLTYFTTVSFLRYDQYYTGRFDLGNMAQTVWNTQHGRIFQLTDPNGVENLSRLAFHADFILIMLAPFYVLWENPKMLLLIQAAVATLGGYFVFRIAQKIIKHDGLALVFATAYFFNPSIQRVTIYDFHAVAFATTFFLAAWYFLIQKRYVLFVVFAVLAGITKEQVWIVVGLFGLYVAVMHKKWLLGAVLAVSGFGLFYYLIWHAIPNALGANHFALSYFQDGGDSPSALVKHYLSSPGEAIETVFAKDRITYIKQLFLPLGYLPFLSPILLLFAAPDLALNLLSGKPHLQQIYYQYTAVISPFLFLSAIYSARFLRKTFPQITYTHLSVYVLTCALLTAYLYSPLPGSKDANLDMFTKPHPHKALLDREIARVPESAKVVASNTIASHLSHRQHITTFPFGIDEAEYIFFQKRDFANVSDYEKFRLDLTLFAFSKVYTTIASEEDLLILRKQK